MTYDQAMAACQAALPSWNDGTALTHDKSCKLASGSTSLIQEVDYWTQSGGSSGTTYGSGWQFTGGVPASNPCAGMTSTTVELPGIILDGYTMSVRGPVQPDGSQAMCTLDVSPIGRPYWNPYGDGGWFTSVSTSPTGDIAGVGQGTDGGLYTGSGAAAPSAPPAPDPLPPPPASPPQACNSASCYNSGSDGYCAQDASGANIACVPAGTASGPSGGCGTSGSVTLCAGSPTPPLPNPSTSGVTDPGTQINATGTGKTADPVSGAISTTTTTVYSSSGGSTSNGSSGATTGAPPTVSSGSGAPASGSSAPASSSTAPGSFAGGTSCTVPPACTGDAVMCGIARTQWATTCQVHTDLAGTSKAPASPSSSVNASQVWVTPTAGTTVGDQANAGVYDQSGGGAVRTCPLTDYKFMSVVGLTVPLSKGCDPLWWLGEAGVAFALFGAARITAGSSV
jgi:hypothetical protein